MPQLEKVPGHAAERGTPSGIPCIQALRRQSLEMERLKHLESAGWENQKKRAAQRENSLRTHHHVHVRK